MYFFKRLKHTLACALLSLGSVAFAAEPQVEITEVLLTPETVSAAEASPAAVQLPIDLKAAAQIATDAFGGEVVKAEEVTESAATHFQIRIVNEGRVKDVVIDAANGEIISPEESAK